MVVKKLYGASPIASMSPTLGKNPCVPITELPSPNASPKPTAQYTSEHSANVSTFLPATCAAFFILVMPGLQECKSGLHEHHQHRRHHHPDGVPRDHQIRITHLLLPSLEQQKKPRRL